MDRNKRAAQAEPVAKFRQRHVRTFPDGGRHFPPMRLRDGRFPPRPVVEVSDLARGLSLPQQFLHHSQ